MNILAKTLVAIAAAVTLGATLSGSTPASAYEYGYHGYGWYGHCDYEDDCWYGGYGHRDFYHDRFEFRRREHRGFDRR